MSAREIAEIFRYCPVCGDARFYQRGGAIVCAACGYEHFLNPVVAVAVLIADPQNRLLLIRRQREPAKGKLAFPGGFAEIGESAEAVAQREIREEINLELEGLKYLTSHPNRYVYREIIYSTIDLFFTARAVSLGPLRALDDVDGIEFLPVDTIRPAELAFDSMRHALACWRTTS